jgi:hypothetical protein
MTLRLVPTILALALLAGCGKPAWRVRAVPRDDIQLPRVDPTAELEVPPRDSVASAKLGDGTPVWLVHRADGGLSVFSALAPDTGRATGVSLLDWRATVRRFSGSHVWDEQGKVLGIAGWDVCTEECPKESDLPSSAPDLDAFLIERLGGSPERIRVTGTPRKGVWRRIPQKPLPAWTQEPRQEALPRMSISEALKLPEGMIVSVAGDVVLVSGEAPLICPDAGPGNRTRCCPSGAPRLYDVDGAPLRRVGPSINRHGATLLRRYRDGFVQYDVGQALGAPGSGDFFNVAKPAGYDTWTLTEPMPAGSPCGWEQSNPTNPGPPWLER